MAVALTGEGADELFAGYQRYKLGYYVQLLQPVPLAIRSAACRLAEKLLGPQDLWSRVLRASINLLSVSYWNNVFMPWEVATLTGLHRESNNPYLEFLESAREKSILDFLIESDVRTRLPEYILTALDKMTMANSLEMRPPFLDNRIVDFALRLPNRLKLHGIQEKFLLRKAFESVLPPDILRPRKLAFSAPYEMWLPRLVRQYLYDAECVSAGLICKRELELLLKGDSCYRGRWSEKTWAILVLELWYRIFISQSITPTPS